MTSAAVRAPRHRWHAPERGTGPAFAISLGAHALLFLAIAFVVRWKTEPAGAVSAELWGGLPPMTQAAPQPVPAPAPPPPPPPRVEPQPEPEPPKADITLEQKKAPPKVEPKKVEPPKKIEPTKKEEPPKKAEPDRKLERQREEEQRQQKAAEAAQAKQRQAAIDRALAAAGPTAASGTGVAGGSGITDTYKGQIVGCIRPNISFRVAENVQPKQHVAEFEVTLLPTGEKAGAPRLVSSSGLPAFDQAVERAILSCNPFPRPREGSMPRSLRLTFDPVDTR